MPKAYKPLSPYDKKLDTPLLQLKEYYPTKTEWASTNREIIYRMANISGTGVNILYTVPVGYYLFITYAYLRGAGNGSYNFGADNRDPLMNFLITNTFCNHVNMSSLIRINGGDRVYCGLAGAGGNLQACFYGFLEKL